MSSSERDPREMLATPWSLDELEMPELFADTRLPELARMSQAPVRGHDGLSAEAEIVAAQDRVRIESAAYARGKADGEQAARADANARVASAIQALSHALESVRVHEARWVANAEENLTALSIAVARHMLAREVEFDPTFVTGLVQRALSQFPLDQVVTVRLHPDDIAACADLMQAPDTTGRTHEIRWLADSHMVRGGCLVEGRERVIDGRVDTALERTYRSIGNIQS